MNTRSYILSGAAAGASIFESGRSTINFGLSGIENVGSKYIKFMVDYGDETDIEIIQPPTLLSTTNVGDLSAEVASHIFNPTAEHIATYNVVFSGIRTDLSIDKYEVSVRIGRTSLTVYKDIKVINSYLYTSPDGVNNLMLTIEAQEPRFVGNVIVPYNKDLTVYLPKAKITPSIDPGIFLRTELYTTGRPFQTFILEQYPTRTSWGIVLEEPQLLVPAIGTEDGLSLLIGEEDTANEPAGVMVDINGVAMDPVLIMIPEYSHEFPTKSGLVYRQRTNQ